MSFVLMLVGILATALGAILIGFGIPINEFSLGNTLILAGTVTAAAGVVVFALSRVVSQLGRVAEAINHRAFAAANMSYDPGQGEPGRTPAPRPTAPSRAPEPRLQAPDFEPPAPSEANRSAAPTVRSATVVVEEQEVSLSPRAPARPAEPATASTGAASGWRPPRPSVTQSPRKPETPRQPAAQGASDKPFEAAWPDGRKAAPTRREPMLEPAAANVVEAGKPEPVSILKSGVVDGMAYTLYTDGSIEAELAQGVVRFGSIEELRNHLEKSA